MKATSNLFCDLLKLHVFSGLKHIFTLLKRAVFKWIMVSFILNRKEDSFNSPWCLWGIVSWYRLQLLPVSNRRLVPSLDTQLRQCLVTKTITSGLQKKNNNERLLDSKRQIQKTSGCYWKLSGFLQSWSGSPNTYVPKSQLHIERNKSC